MDFFKGTFAQGLEKAKKEGRLLMVDIFAGWCGPCRALEAAYGTPPFEGALADLVVMKIDGENGEGPGLMERFGADSYPTVIFFAPSGEEAGRIVGFGEQFLEQVERIKRGEGSVEAVRAKLEKEPENCRLLFTLGEMLLQQEEGDEAMDTFEKILEIDPGNAQGFTDRAEFRLVTCEEYPSRDAAVKALRDFLGKYPHSPHAADAVKGLLEHTADIEAAVAAMKEAMSLCGPDPVVLQAVAAYFYRHTPLRKLVVSLLRKIVEKVPDEPSSYQLLVRVLVEDHDFAAAEEALAAMRSKFPGNESLDFWGTYLQQVKRYSTGGW